jgi:hypothetical protein
MMYLIAIPYILNLVLSLLNYLVYLSNGI